MNAEAKLGLLFIALSIDLMLFTVSLTQIVSYFQRQFSKDKPTIQITMCALLLVNVVMQAITFGFTISGIWDCMHVQTSVTDVLLAGALVARLVPTKLSMEHTETVCISTQPNILVKLMVPLIILLPQWLISCMYTITFMAALAMQRSLNMANDVMATRSAINGRVTSLSIRLDALVEATTISRIECIEDGYNTDVTSHRPFFSILGCQRYRGTDLTLISSQLMSGNDDNADYPCRNVTIWIHLSVADITEHVAAVVVIIANSDTMGRDDILFGIHIVAVLGIGRGNFATSIQAELF
ncbi:hypothetical protein F5146DRAFT_1000319 [Armillaria mellea]|nr:hypothetical protein F5146DRAFT_1000319 [Armillaria mellea]